MVFLEYREIIGSIAGTPFGYDPENDIFIMACEPELKVHAYKTTAAYGRGGQRAPQLVLVIEHERNDEMRRDALQE